MNNVFLFSGREVEPVEAFFTFTHTPFAVSSLIGSTYTDTGAGDIKKLELFHH
ncbi:hypothetical protein JCM19233_2128 [Vibrio astriarenae]|nr:hypothetical protein JCM19233_2128 [Vibrio sp. C7]